VVLTRSRLFFNGDVFVVEDEDPGDVTIVTTAREHDEDDYVDGVVEPTIILSMSSMAPGSTEHRVANDCSCEVIGSSPSKWISTSSSLPSMSSMSMEFDSNDIDNAIAARMLFGRGRYGECKT
jgi:hypothetical protein